MVEEVVIGVLSNSKPNSQKQKPDSQVSLKQKRKEDALELAELIYDMFVRTDKIEEEQRKDR